MKKNKVLKIHQYTITEPQNDKSRWQTYIKNDKGDRQKISSTTEQGLFDKLYEHYFIRNAQTLRWLYPIWIEQRKNEGVSANTIRRNQNHWDKYYANHKVIDTPITKLSVEQIENFFYDCINNYDMTTKELANMRFIFSDMMKYAHKRKYITSNIFSCVDVKLTGCKPPSKKNDSSRVYLHDEKEKLFCILEKDLQDNPTKTECLAIFILFKLGLRMGELVALKWEDIDFKEKEIHIHRTEIKDANEEGKLTRIVVNHTKKKSIYGDRFLPLSNYELDIFEKVKQINCDNDFFDDNFVFCDSNGRITSSKIDSYLRKKCKLANIPVKSTHDIRRTVASEMFNNGVPVEIIQYYLGHSDIKTTYGYILDNNRKEETNKMILQSLEKMNGLKRTQIA